MTIKKGLILGTIIGVVTLFAFAPEELKNKVLSLDVLEKVAKPESQGNVLPAIQKISAISSDGELILEWDSMVPNTPYYENMMPTEYIVEYRASGESQWSTLTGKFINKKSDTNDKDKFSMNKVSTHGLLTVIPNLQNGKEYSARISLKNKFGISNPSKEVTGTPILSLIRKDMKFPFQKDDGNIVALDGNGNIYFLAPQKQGINKYDSIGKISMNIGKGLFEDGYPTSIKIDSKGNIYVTKNGDGGLVNSLLKFSPSGENIMTIKNSSGKEKYHLFGAWDVDIDKDGNIYIVNGGYIQKFDSTGKFITNIGAPRGTNDNQLNDTRTIDIDIFGDIYVLDDGARNGEGAIKKFDSTGKFLGILEFKKSDDTQFKGMEKLEKIDYFALDESNNIYIATHGIIKKFNSEGKFLAKSDCNIKNTDCFGWSNSIAVSSNGEIFTGDKRKFIIQE